LPVIARGPVRRIDSDVVFKRDRVIVVVALAVISALAWIYVVRLSAGMDMGGMDMTGFRMVSTGFAMGHAARE
jgi:predicted metal-binding membrane protein